MPRKLLAAIFISAGALQLAGPNSIRDSFARWGYPDWFRVVTGMWEIEATMMLLSRGLSVAGATQLSLLMLGALYTHVKTPGEQLRAIFPAAMLVALSRI